MLDGRPRPSPLSRPSAATADVGEGNERLCVREAVADGAERCDGTPKPRGGARPGAGRSSRPRKPNGRPPLRPTEESRRFVGSLVTVLNVTHRQVAQVMGLAVGTLRKHYREELDRAKVEVDIAVGETFIAKCLGGTGREGDERDWRKADTKALIWYTKTQLGWREKTDVELNGGLTIKIGKEFKDI